MRVALGLCYRGARYRGWQSQPGGQTVQDALETALSRFADERIRTLCAGRTDTGVHGLNQVVHFDTARERDLFSWVRGPNTYLPADIAVQWCRFVPDAFHARNSAIGRRYAYVLLESPVRPAIESGACGWLFRSLDGAAMQAAAQCLLGEHDFSAFRAAECQAASPIKVMREITVARHGAYWRFEFEASAFLHHMIRNIMGCLLMVGTGVQPPDWVLRVREARDRKVAAPTFSADGLYFLGPRYAPAFGLPEHVPGMDWLPS